MVGDQSASEAVAMGFAVTDDDLCVECQRRLRTEKEIDLHYFICFTCNKGFKVRNGKRTNERQSDKIHRSPAD